MSHGATYRADHITGSGGRAAVVQEFLNQQKKARKPGRLSYSGCLSSSMEAKKAANLKAEDRGPVFDSHLSRRRGRGSHSSRAFFVRWFEGESRQQRQTADSFRVDTERFERRRSVIETFTPDSTGKINKIAFAVGCHAVETDRRSRRRTLARAPVA